MKAEQFNRLMRVNGGKNLWLLRNTNQLYENAVKTYYSRSTSLLPYSPEVPQTVRTREENQAPVRTLAVRRERHSVTEYPRNHKQMADQAASVSSGQLLNTVMQASRRRSMSFTAGGLRMYSNQLLDNSDEVQERLSPENSSTMLNDAEQPANEPLRERDLDLCALSGRSMSLPPRTTLELGMGYTLGKGKGPPSCKHHFIALEKTMSANQASMAKQRKRNKYDSDAEQLMVVDEALKQRLAVRFDRQSEDEPNSARFRVGYGSASLIHGRHMPGTQKSYKLRSEKSAPHDIGKEHTHFHTLSERIRQFEVIQFADGPVTFQAFNRRQGYGSGRYQSTGSKHLPKQQPCLSFHNVLHTNHRQRSLSFQTRSQSHEMSPELEEELKPKSKSKPKPKQKQKQKQKHQTPLAMKANSKRSAPTLGQLGSRSANWRPQQQQQQQHQHQHQQHQRPQRPKHIMDVLAQQIPSEPPAMQNLLSDNSKMRRKRSNTPSKILKSKSKWSVKQASSKRNLNQSTGRKANAKFVIDANDNQMQKSAVLGRDTDEDIEEALLKPTPRFNADSIESVPPKATASNKLSRTSHLTFIKDTVRRPDPAASPRLDAQLQELKNLKQSTRRVHSELPKQPPASKGAHHLLASSATQVSAHKRAFKNRQQLQQAEMLHLQAQQLPTELQLKQQQQLQQHKQEQQELRNKRFHQQQQYQHQLRLAKEQATVRQPSYFPTVSKRSSMPQAKPEPQAVAKLPVRMPSSSTSQLQFKKQLQQQLQQQQQQQQQQEKPSQSVRQALPKIRSGRQLMPEGNRSMPKQLSLPLLGPEPHGSRQHRASSIVVPLEVTTKQKRKPVPRLAYSYKTVGQTSASEESIATISQQRQQQQQQQLQQQQLQQQQL
ncbi:PREDICTED: putative mediator of RNA polymerase II transcription subunit 12, partial [Drosophila arizonae]|uniref:Mediator of RNA polymerase II transcription subunit 12 n=1 Tax=Drosophila arizonae TaxID=7263 RepID=A0ABM1PZQ9_DROAR